MHSSTLAQADRSTLIPLAVHSNTHGCCGPSASTFAPVQLVASQQSSDCCEPGCCEPGCCESGGCDCCASVAL